MPFKYCTECGYKNVYTIRRAKFCAGCGKTLVEEQLSTRNSSQLAQANLSEDDVSSEKEGIPNIEKLEYTVDAVSKAPKISDLINTRSEKSERFERQRTKGNSKPLTLEEAEAQSMGECSSSISRPTD